MRTIDAVKNVKIVLAKTGTNETLCIRFGIKAWKEAYPNGYIVLFHRRQNDSESQPVPNFTTDSEYGYWLVTSADTAYVGSGEAELVMSENGKIAKSVTFTTSVERSISSNAEQPPEPFEGYVAQVMAAAERVESATGHAPYIGENNHWYVWDINDEEFVDTGVSAQGPQGPQGQQGPQGERGETGPAGPQGPAGEAPIDDTTPAVDKVYSSSKVNGELMSLNQAIGTKADKTALAKTDNMVDVLYKLTKGQAWDIQADNTEAYSKVVPSGTHLSVVKGWQGKSLVWNQLVGNSTFASKTWWNYSSMNYTVANNVATCTPSGSESRFYMPNMHRKKNHVYYYSVEMNIPESYTERFIALQIKDGVTWGELSSIKDGQWHKYQLIQKYIEETDVDVADRVRIFHNYNATGDVQVRNGFMVDLTNHLGAGNEPSTTSDPRIAWIETYVAEHTEYNAGQIISADVNNIYARGANIWDSTTYPLSEDKYINSNTGLVASGSGADWACTEGYIPIDPKDGMIYMVRGRSSSSATGGMAFYDVDKAYISGCAAYDYPNGIAIPANAKYYRFSYKKADVSVHFGVYIGGVHDYKPYVAPVSNLIPSAVLAQYPLRSAGSEYDTIIFDGSKWLHTQNTGLVDMGNLVFSNKDTTYPRCRFVAPSDMFCEERSRKTDMLTADYATMKNEESIGDIPNMSIYGGFSSSTEMIWIHDTNIISAETASAVLTGKKLIYILKTPIVTDITDLMEGFENYLTEVEVGGTITFVNDNGLSVYSSVDNYRNLSEVTP